MHLYSWRYEVNEEKLNFEMLRSFLPGGPPPVDGGGADPSEKKKSKLVNPSIFVKKVN